MNPENRVAKVHKRYEQYKNTFKATACEVCGAKHRHLGMSTWPQWFVE